tara:strand:+ start:778 stop:1314 length:537 start_codon:yes stop_codon:yes gene_type:complete
MTKKSFSVEITGFDKVKKKTDLPNISSKPLRTFFRVYGQKVKNEAKSIAPEDTGALKRSIRQKKVQSIGRMPKGITIRADSPKASFVHGHPRYTPGIETAKAGQLRSKPHFPPLNKLAKWGPIRSNPELLWPVALSIADKGTPLVPFLYIAERNTKVERKALLATTAKQIEKQAKKVR